MKLSNRKNILTLMCLITTLLFSSHSLNASTNANECNELPNFGKLDKAISMQSEKNKSNLQFQFGILFESDNNYKCAIYWWEEAASNGHMAAKLALKKTLKYKKRLLERMSKQIKKYEEMRSLSVLPDLSMNASISSPYSLNMETTTENYSPITFNGFKNVSEDDLSTLSIDVDTASYSNMRRYIQQYNQMPPIDSVRIEELINYFSYDYPQPLDYHPFSIISELSYAPWNKKHHLIHIGIQGKNIDFAQVPASNIVFLIDTSGSMYGSLGLVQKSLRMLVDNLRDQDTISIVAYAGSAGLVLPATSGKHKHKIKQAIQQLKSGGSTAGGAGIDLAYKMAKQNFIADGNNRVILATDGDFNVGVSSQGGLERLIEQKREDNIFLSVLGFGYGNLQDAIMEQLADKGNGNYSYIDNLLEAKKVLVKEMGSTLFTIAKDVKIQIAFNPIKVKSYRLIGYENRVLNKEDFNDDKKDAGELGSGHTVTALYEIIPADSKEQVASVDKSKYQETVPTDIALNSNEIMTIKFRYKEPTGDQSKLIELPVIDNIVDFSNSSDSFKFSSAVASFGMLLRGSEYKGESNYQQIIDIAKESKGEDIEGYRSEFIKLVETAQII
jgi:Ca-activated chloride channel family protein